MSAKKVWIAGLITGITIMLFTSSATAQGKQCSAEVIIKEVDSDFTSIIVERTREGIFSDVRKTRVVFPSNVEVINEYGEHSSLYLLRAKQRVLMKGTLSPKGFVLKKITILPRVH